MPIKGHVPCVGAYITQHQLGPLDLVLGEDAERLTRCDSGSVQSVGDAT